VCNSSLLFRSRFRFLFCFAAVVNFKTSHKSHTQRRQRRSRRQQQQKQQQRQRQRRLAFVANIIYQPVSSCSFSLSLSLSLSSPALFGSLLVWLFICLCLPSRFALLRALLAAFFVRSLTCGFVKLWNVFALCCCCCCSFCCSC